MMKTHFLIGAPCSGSGKTTLTIGLLRALHDKGISVQSFKCGPDYIDTRYHAAASYCEPVNLDTWMASKEHVRDIYARYSSAADCSVTEGVMGLFDGYTKMEGSSAEIASMLHIPVIMVIDAVSAAYSAAPLIYGFKKFHPDVNVAGVIFNKVASASHFSFLKEACEDVHTECFGCLPLCNDITIPSRNLGLSIDDKEEMESYIVRISEIVSENVDISLMLNKLSYHGDDEVILQKDTEQVNPAITIAVARDEAFNFTYRENIDALTKIGKVIYFSPLRDSILPPADIIYLPGGYIGQYASILNSNKSMLSRIREFAEHDGRIFAESGGMLYLCNSINISDKDYEMAGILPFNVQMNEKDLSIGYRTMTYNGTTYRGHEFHYSHITNPDALPSLSVLYNARGMEVPVRQYRYRNVIAGFTHWYWGEQDFLSFWK